jgi:hypothetical protein
MSIGAADAMRDDVSDLVDAGRYLDAVDALTARNRETRDAATESLLASLRRDAFIEFEDLGEPEAEPADPPDPFPGVTGLPEIARSDLTAELLTGALQHHGVLMVRGLLDVPVAERLGVEVNRAFDAQQRWREGTPVSETTPTFVPLDNHERYPLRPKAALGRQWERYRRVLAVDAPHLLFELFDEWQAVGLDRVLREYFGSRPVLGENKFCVRRIPYRDSPFGDSWHQEASVFDVDQYLRAVNLWMALSPCGERAPAIEFLPAPIGEVVTTEHAYSVSEASAIEAARGRTAASPVFEPGDGVLFNELTFHRTNQREDMDEIRLNVEAWFFAPWSHPGHNGRVVF